MTVEVRGNNTCDYNVSHVTRALFPTTKMPLETKPAEKPRGANRFALMLGFLSLRAQTISWTSQKHQGGW